MKMPTVSGHFFFVVNAWGCELNSPLRLSMGARNLILHLNRIRLERDRCEVEYDLLIKV